MNLKRQRFLRLAEYRTNEILKKLRVLSHCANRSAYEYSKVEVDKIFLEIERELKAVRAKFTYQKQNKTFKLNE